MESVQFAGPRGTRGSAIVRVTQSAEALDSNVDVAPPAVAQRDACIPELA